MPDLFPFHGGYVSQALDPRVEADVYHVRPFAGEPVEDRFYLVHGEGCPFLFFRFMFGFGGLDAAERVTRDEFTVKRRVEGP